MPISTKSRHVKDIVLGQAGSMLALWDSQLKCRYANRAYEQWFGVRPEDLIGRSMQELLGPELFALNQPYVIGALSGEPQRFERAIQCPDGRVRHSLAHYLPHMEHGRVAGFVAEVTDVTPLKEAELALHAQEEARARLQSVIRRKDADLEIAQRIARMGSWHWEIEADICTWSDELYRIFGLDPKRLPPSFDEHAQLYTPRSWDQLKDAVGRACAEGAPYLLQLEFVRGDGSTGWLEARGEAERDELGRIVGLHGIAQEISDQRRLGSPSSPLFPNMPLELRDTDDGTARHDGMPRVPKAVGTGRSRLEVLGQVAGQVAHDVANVFHVLHTVLEVIRIQSTTPPLLRAVDMGKRNLERGRMMVSDIMSFAREQAFDLTPVDVNRLIRELDEELRLLAPEHLVKTSLCAQEPVALTDKSQLGRSLINLLTNARDATPAGGSIAISTRVIGGTIRSGRTAAAMVDISVADNGSGMTREVAQRATEPLFTTKESGKGTGFGLSVVECFARQCGGSISITTAPGRGTTVTCSLPLVVATQGQQLPLLPDDALGSGVRRSHGACVLHVSNCPSHFDATKLILSRPGIEVVVAESAAVALEKLREHDFALALLDFDMPGLQVFELAQQIHATPQSRGVPLIFVTEEGMDPVQVSMAYEAGAVDILVRPLHPLVLESKVGAFLSLYLQRKALGDKKDHFERLLQANQQLATELANAHERVLQAAFTDELTGVPNRRRILQLAAATLTDRRMQSQPICVAILDLDHFKSINDTHGHAGGDSVLKHFCQHTQSQLRAGQAIGRLGGEEFLLLLPGTGLATAEAALERVRDTLSTAAGIRYTFSAGVAMARPGDTVAEVLDRADRALYCAKAHGRNRTSSEPMGPHHQ